MKREYRKLTPKEWASITSSRPVVRRIPPERLSRRRDISFTPVLTSNTERSVKRKDFSSATSN